MMIRCKSHSELQFFFFFNDTATTEIYTLSLHDALPISAHRGGVDLRVLPEGAAQQLIHRLAGRLAHDVPQRDVDARHGDRKSTRLNSSHANISYAVFCLKKKNTLSSNMPQYCITLYHII